MYELKSMIIKIVSKSRPQARSQPWSLGGTGAEAVKNVLYMPLFEIPGDNAPPHFLPPPKPRFETDALCKILDTSKEHGFMYGSSFWNEGYYTGLKIKTVLKTYDRELTHFLKMCMLQTMSTTFQWADVLWAVCKNYDFRTSTGEGL